MRIGDVNKAARARRMRASSRRFVLVISLLVAVVVLFVVGGIIVYNSTLFTVSRVQVTGVEHLTANEMNELAAVPSGTTLLRCDTAGIESRLKSNPWVESVEIRSVFPDTLELIVSERVIAAVVEVPVDHARAIQKWAISEDGIWLMLIPREESEMADAVSSKVFEDAESAMLISDVLNGVIPQVGAVCTDDPIINALQIVAGLTTDLADQVKRVSATGSETTTLTLDNGIDIAFGTAEYIREKERVCLQLIEENPDRIAYINVRVVDRPTWRAI